MVNRIYRLRTKASEKDFTENEERSELKKLYLDYLEPNKLATEEQLINAIKNGIFVEASLIGAIDE